MIVGDDTAVSSSLWQKSINRSRPEVDGVA